MVIMRYLSTFDILACMFKIIYGFTYMHNLSRAFPALKLNLCKIGWLQPTIDMVEDFKPHKRCLSKYVIGHGCQVYHLSWVDPK